MSFPENSLEARTLKFAYDYVFEKVHSFGVGALTENQRAFRTVYIADTNIGGGSIFRVFHDYPELLEDLDQAYARLQMPKKADAIEAIMALLPTPLPLDHERLAQIEEIQENQGALDAQIQKIESTCYSDSGENVDEHLYSFVVEHRAEFLE